jgi:hypothetical protein
MDYTRYMVARIEHEQRIRSLAPVPEYDDPVVTDQPRWVSKQAGRLLCALGNGLAAIGEKLYHERGTACDVLSTGQQESGALS